MSHDDNDHPAHQPPHRHEAGDAPGHRQARTPDVPSDVPPERAPAFNAPVPVLACIAVFALVHAGLQWWVDPDLQRRLLLTFAIFPPLYKAVWLGVPADQLPGGLWGLLAAPFTHFFLHANWMHVGMNALWLLVFGTPVARRLGGWRCLALALVSAAAGGIAFLLLHWGEEALLVGASGGISGLMGASVRLIYARGGTLVEGLRADVRRVRPLTFVQALALPGPRYFVLAWIGINVVISVVGFGVGSGMERIAGEAHLAGFFAGMALLGPLDRRRG